MIEIQAVADPRTGTAIVIGAIDNLVKGAAGQAIQNMNLAFGLDEAVGLPTRGGVPVSVTFPRGFVASGVTAGCKPSGLPDLGLLVGEPGTIVAGLFTTNRVEAAPVAMGRARLRRRVAPRAVVVNSGQANAATGDRGVADALAMTASRGRAARSRGRRRAAELDRRDRRATATWSDSLPALPSGRDGAVEAMEGSDFARAIMTTDTVDKQASRRAPRAPRRRVREGCGDDRARPRHDARVPHDRRRRSRRTISSRLADEVLKPRFNAFTVDASTSTNDTVLLFASGAAGTIACVPVRRRWDGARRRASAEVADDLVRQLIADGEGVGHVLVVDVMGAARRRRRAHRRSRGRRFAAGEDGGVRG